MTLIKELLTTYWSQLTLILLAIGSLLFYFIKRLYDTKSKKLEVNHSLFQQNKISAVNDFFLIYSKTELMWNQIAIYEILEKKIGAKEIDIIIFPNLNELKKTLLQLKIYFGKDDYQYFKQLVDGFMSINKKLSDLYFRNGNELTIVHKVNEFNFFKDDTIKVNNSVMDKLALIIRTSFDA